MNQIDRINRTMNLEPDRNNRMSMAAIIRDTQKRLDTLKEKGERR